jgi:hypothetical protein
MPASTTLAGLACARRADDDDGAALEAWKRDLRNRLTPAFVP